MGKRKLRFDLWKNREWKKLIVQIPLALIKPPSLLVRLPLSVYLSAPAKTPAVLVSRLNISQQVPSQWTLVEKEELFSCTVGWNHLWCVH